MEVANDEILATQKNEMHENLQDSFLDINIEFMAAFPPVKKKVLRKKTQL